MACASEAACLFLLLCMLLVPYSDATIKIVGGDSEFLSRPDNYVGMGMKEGIRYPARIQKVHGDEHLCKGNLIHVNVPEDGRPVALLVKKGSCSYAQKAEFASTKIFPPNVVKMLIIDGETRINDEEQQNYVPSEYEDHEDEDPPALGSWEYPSYYNGDTNSTLSLRRRHNSDITVALLHVSYHTGAELSDLIINEDPDVREAGGILVTVDSDAPPLSQSIIWIWTAVCFCLSLLVCCCLAAYIEELVESQEPEPEPPRRPRRRRLTLEQVRKFPIGVFDGSRLVYSDEEESLEWGEGERVFLQPSEEFLDECVICLDDYEIGDALRCLPCGHAFHSNCIAKWLIERSATCPLCKEDLYEEEVEDEEDETQEQQPTQADLLTETVENTTTTTDREPWWRSIFRRTPYLEIVNEELIEPLLQEAEREEQELENTISEATSVEEPPASEESNDEPTSQEEEEATSESNDEPTSQEEEEATAAATSNSD